MSSPRAPTDPVLCAATLEDAWPFAAYVQEHIAESGREGAPHFSVTAGADREEVRESARARWSRRLDEPIWGRAWLLVLGERRVVGHVELRGGRVRSEMHRAVLAMGMLEPHRGRGHGRRLIDVAVGWARKNGLAFIDLGVFTENERARRLYESAGFVAQGLRPDAFRLDDGTRIDDVQMSLEL